MVRVYTRAESPFWQAEILVGGKPKRISTSIPKNPKFKRKAADAAEAEEERLNATTGLLIDEAAEMWLKDSPLNPRSIQTYELRIRAIVEFRPDARISDITPAWVRAYIKDRKAVVPDIRVRNELTVFSSLMEYAIETGLAGAPEVNPMKLVSKKKLLAAYQPKPRWLKPEQVAALIEAASPKFWKPFILLLVETGMRRTELAELTWDEVNLKLGIITLSPDRVKTKKGRAVVLSDTAIRTLQGIARHPTSPYVFHSPRSGLKRKIAYSTWQSIAKKAGVPDARIHDLRHTFASLTRQGGMAKDDRKSIMGHTTEEAHEIYSHSEITVLRESINRFAPSTQLAQYTQFRGIQGAQDAEKPK